MSDIKPHKLWCTDCITGAAQHLRDKSIDLIICDPPFGIRESKLDQMYKRDADAVIQGYVEAPHDYFAFTKMWMEQAKRILKKNGSMYVVVGHTPLLDALLAARELDLQLINHLIWKFNFGAFTSTKYVTSHYHILYLCKKGAKPYFNANSRFGPQYKDEQGGSLRYQDLEDVFYIKKEYAPGEKKNVNKLPNELIAKLIEYSSRPGDIVADFFMGNFTTAYVALGLGRNVIGFELNKNSFDYHEPLLNAVVFGSLIREPVVVEKPPRQGSSFNPNEKESIQADARVLGASGKKKKDIIIELMSKYERGRWSIQRVLDEERKKDENGNSTSSTNE